jgi:DNA repair exonuclease SbcCD nuclease subunit
MSKKWLLIGDPHYEVNNLHMMKQATNEILQLIDKRKPELCIVLGDTLHTHNRIEMLAQSQAINWLKAIATKCRLIVLIGNHDRINNQDFLSPIHPFVGLKETENITVVDTTIWDKEENLIYVPYVPPGRFKEALQKVGYNPGDENTKPPKAIFAHQEFKGCLLGERESTKGDFWNQEWPQIFSGHIHTYHILPKIIYVGTFHQQNYGEDPDKAIMFVNVDEEEFKMNRISLKSVPKRVTVHLTLAELPQFTEKIPPNCQVKVVVHVDATERKSLDGNPYYQSLKEVVDKVIPKVTGDKANIAQNMVNQMKSQGHLNAQQKIFSIEEVVQGMLADDPYSLNIFKGEILE